MQLAEILRNLLMYEPETGKLYWRPRPADMFPAVRHARRWNRLWANKPAFTSVGNHGYRQGRIFGVQYLAHRVIWAIETGAWPVDQIDHIDGDRMHNRMENLREATHTENRKNQKRPSNNKSGVVGVHWARHCGKWQARIGVNGRKITLGYCDDIAEAAEARADAEIKYGYHVNHGRAA